MPSNITPSSPRQVVIDPHLPAPPRSHSITMSPNALSPSRAIGPHQPRPSRGNSNHGRSYREDPEGARERQMQQDLESAMSMSRARSGSINQETSPGMRPSQMHFPSTSPIDESAFPMLSDLEEAEMDRARSSRFHVQGDDGSDDENPYNEHSRRRSSHHNDEERSEGMMDMDVGARQSGSSGFDSHARLLPERGDPRGMGMQPSKFDFAAMEEYAQTEREKLMGGDATPKWIPDAGGVRQRTNRGSRGSRESGAAGGQDRPVQPGSYDTAMERTTTTSMYGDDNALEGHITEEEQEHGHEHEQTFSPKESEGGTTQFHRRRQRKLSQSNPVMRRQGKLALFEGLGSLGGANEPGESPGGFKAPRQPKNLGTGPQAGFVPFTDAAPGHDRPYRFSFYSNALPVTIHSRSLAELPAEGQTFTDLFKGRGGAGSPGDGEGATEAGSYQAASGLGTPNGDASNGNGAKMSLLARAAGAAGAHSASAASHKGPPSGGPPGGSSTDEDPEACTWWLDVLSPTDEEMRMLAKVFGIHPLTTEDILLEETREKIELFRNYYLVCFRSFDQDPYSQTYLEPLNMYIIVFREGTLSFHFRGTPHPQNVRRRIKHLKDYISVTSDWISYALIDDITDAFGPLIQSIEYEVDSIDELVLMLNDAEQSDMLKRIGTCRKKVMGLLRLMGNKADVVKGLAKRCNEQWLVAPKSDIGLYLSDIQDHLITMTQNLNHYEKILSRSHSNYLAQISIEMTDANNQINDVLSKLTALGTVLVPMNLVTGLWGMNVHVPGEGAPGFGWFGGILGCLAAFAVLGAFATWKCFVR